MSGFSRPGALQMVAAAVLAVISAVGPLFIAATRPSHEWVLILSGLPAMAISLSGFLIAILYVVGFFRFCTSKGYSKWLAFWLLLGNFFGLVVLLILPDRKPEHNGNT